MGEDFVFNPDICNFILVERVPRSEASVTGEEQRFYGPFPSIEKAEVFQNLLLSREGTRTTVEDLLQPALTFEEEGEDV